MSIKAAKQAALKAAKAKATECHGIFHNSAVSTVMGMHSAFLDYNTKDTEWKIDWVESYPLRDPVCIPGQLITY